MGLGVTMLGVLFHLGQNLLRVFQELVNGPGVGGVERQGDHGLHRGEIDLDVLVVPGIFAGVEGKVITGALVGLIEALRHLIRLPDGGEAGGLRGHHVDAVAIVDG